MRVIVIGGGIGGLTAALALRHAGIEVSVHERAPCATEVGAGISLWGNATRALDSIGAGSRVLDRGEPLRIGAMKTWRGKVLSRIEMAELDRRLGVRSIIIHRAELLDALLAQLPSGVVRFGHEFESCEQDEDRVVARFRGGDHEEGDLVIGADGLRSRVRASIFDATDDPRARPPRYSGYTCWRGVVDWPVSEQIPPGYVGESWGRGARFGIARMTRDRIYWFATRNAPAMASGFVDRTARDSVAAIVRDWWRPIPDLVAATHPDHVVRHDLFDRPPLPGWSKGRITLLGDAAHPTTPNIGQGGCLAIEDGIVLARRLATERDVPTALAKYEADRYDRCAEIVRFSWRLGVVGQFENPLLCAIRDFAFGKTPSRKIVAQHDRYVGFDATGGEPSSRVPHDGTP